MDSMSIFLSAEDAEMEMTTQGRTKDFGSPGSRTSLLLPESLPTITWWHDVVSHVKTTMDVHVSHMDSDTGIKICSARARPDEHKGAIARIKKAYIPICAGNGDVPICSKTFAKLLSNVQASGGISNPTTRYGDSMQKPTIYPVPSELREQPQQGYGYEMYNVAVEIGLLSRYHHTLKTEKLAKYKWCCVRQLISRHRRLLEPVRTPVFLLGCMESMKRLQSRIRESYYESSSLKSDDEVAMEMLLDGCFILHRVLKYARRAERDPDCNENEDEDWTQVFGSCWVWQLVTRDLLLLENQIPFFVLRELFKELKDGDDDEADEEILVKGSIQLFRSLCPQMLSRTEDTCSAAIACDDVHHLLHLFYLSVGFPASHLPLLPRRHAADTLLPELPQWIPCAKELEEAGIRFRKRKKFRSFLDVKFDFNTGVLEIPPLQLYDYSNALFRNLVAFEQTYPDTRGDISAYAVFMGCLIDTPEDMRILHLRGILVNQMNGEQDASRFFSRICAQVYFPDDNCMVQVMDSVNKYMECRRHQWRAALVRNYFSNPWMAMSVLAAVLLLALTVLQTFFTVYPYFKPPK